MSAKKRQKHRKAAETKINRRARVRTRKREERIAHDAIVARALEEKREGSTKVTLLGVHPDLRTVISRRAQKLICPEYRAPLVELSNRRQGGRDWVRPIAGWKPRGKSAETLFKSLARHLWVKYPIPEFLYRVFLLTENSEAARWGKATFFALGNGESLYKMVKAGRFPVPLTKRMCHTFMQIKGQNHEFIAAIRHAQIKTMGGSHRLAQAIVASPRLGGTLHPDEDFWMTVLQWFCQQPMFDPAEAGPVLDWVAFKRAQDAAFTMKGRTGLSVLRSVTEWHTELAQERGIGQHEYRISGLLPWQRTRKVQLPMGGHYTEDHQITEILSAKELASEGRALKHCVYSYSLSIQRGTTSIWSYRIDGKRILTLEVHNRSRRLVQCRGKCNRLPTASEMSFVSDWLRLNLISSNVPVA